MKKSYRVFSILLILILVFACFATPSWAEDALSEDDYEFTVSDGEVTITKYIGEDRAVTIPSELGGLPVTTIGEFAFSECKAITKIVIPDSVTSIENVAFNRCERFNIYVPPTVVNIAEYAFCSLFMENLPVEPGYPPVVGANPRFEPNQSLTLWVYADSEAYRQAIELGIPAVTITEYTTDTLGDINGDENIDAQDALLA